MRKYLFSLSLLFVMPGFLNASGTNDILFNNVSIAYFGETFTHPGAVIGTEWVFSGGEWFSWILRADLGFYVHPRNHTGIFIYPSFGFRANFIFGGFAGVSAGLGYLHTFSGAPVYEIRDGVPVQVTDFGSANLMIPFSLELGYDFRINTGIPLRFFICAGLFLEYPYNRMILPHFLLQAGVNWYFGGGQ